MKLCCRAFHVEQAAQQFRLGGVALVREGERAHVDGHEDGTGIVVHALDEVAARDAFGVEVHDEGIPVVVLDLLHRLFFGLYGLDGRTDQEVRKHFQASTAVGVVVFPDENAAFAVIADYRLVVFCRILLVKVGFRGLVHFLVFKIVCFFYHNACKYSKKLAIIPMFFYFCAQKINKHRQFMDQTKIRNVAIIAHVDHGKTTLVDQLLKQCGTFHENEEVNERVMDSDNLERERGITILSKNTSVMYKGYRVNIVDTPGHADFGGQVERVLGTVDGVLLVVDAFEGPMAQTRFVTQKALELGLTPIVVVNKIDRDGCNPHGALDKVFDLFCELNATEEQLDFGYVYGSGRKGICKAEVEDPDGDFSILMDKIIERIPAPKGDPAAEPLLQIASLEYSSFLGRLAVGRVQEGTFKPNQTYAQAFTDGTVKTIRPQKILRYEGLTPKPVEEAGPGEIILIAGLDTFDIGDTISATSNPRHLPRIHIDPPTISMVFTVNTSPLAGKYGGKFMTGNQLQERLERAHMADPALLVEKVDGASTFKVSGRGILHLTILVENMRRELYEFTIGSPQVIFQTDANGKLLEPVEDFKVEVPNEFSGACIQEIQQRKGEMVNMTTDDNDRVSLEFIVPSRGLIGIRPKLLSLSKGYAVTQSFFKEYQPYKGEIPTRINGVLIAKEPGEAASYALSNLEDRGYLVIGPGAEVYPGMIVGEHNRDVDITVNVTKGKHLTNMRSKSADDMIQLTPYRRMTLEECVTFINEDECIEVTPEVLRLRKTELDPIKRKQMSKKPAEDDD